MFSLFIGLNVLLVYLSLLSIGLKNIGLETSWIGKKIILWWQNILGL